MKKKNYNKVYECENYGYIYEPNKPTVDEKLSSKNVIRYMVTCPKCKSETYSGFNFTKEPIKTSTLHNMGVKCSNCDHRFTFSKY